MFSLLYSEKDAPGADPSTQLVALPFQEFDVAAVRVSSYCLKRSVDAPEIISRRFS
jgi:hypothetical protein